MTRGGKSSSNEVWSATDLAGNPHLVEDKAQRIREMFAGIAASYDLNNRVHSFGRDQAWRRRAVRLAGTGPSDRVLDVACGTGDLAEAMADARPASVIGIDFTPAMIDLARAKASRRRRAAGVPVPEYRHGDATDLAFDDAAFDVVSIAFGIRNVNEPERALAEFRRVLRPGGRLVILEFSRPRNRVLRWLTGVYTERIMPVSASLLARDRTGAYRYLPRSVASFIDRGTLAEMLERRGFGSIREQEMSFGICVAYLAVAG